jgi:hypothetical protein
MSAYSNKRTPRKSPLCRVFLFGELRRNFRQVLTLGVAGEGQKRHNGLQEKKKPIAALTGEMAGGGQL